MSLRHVKSDIWVIRVAAPAEARKISTPENTFHARYARYQRIQLIFLERKFSRLKEDGKAEEKPERTRADSTAANDGKTNLFSNINGKTQDSICYNESDGRTRSNRGSWEQKHLSKKRLGNSLESIEHLHELIAQSRVVFGKAIGDGVQTETGIATEMGLDVGESEETTADVVGDQEGDVESG